MSNLITIGEVRIGFVLDMIPPPRDPDAFFDGVTVEDWDPYHGILEEGKIQLYYGHFFIQSSGKLIMVDTGMGPGPHADRGNQTGELLAQLGSQGINPEDIDIVVHTHLHPDHVGWNIDMSTGIPRPQFPNARYLVPRVDWDYFTEPSVLATAPHVKDSVVPLDRLGLLDLVEDGHHLTKEVSTLDTPGHTPGHQVILINSEGEKAMVVGDVLHNKVQVNENDWCAMVDTDKPASRGSRRYLLDMAENDSYLVAAGHFNPHDHLGKVIRVDGRRCWQAI